MNTLVACMLALLVFAIIHDYVSHEDNAYYLDYQLYWQVAANSARQLQQNAVAWLDGLGRSVWSDPYNELFTLPLLPAMLAGHGGRLWYIEALGLLFMMPAMWVIFAGFKTLTGAPHQVARPMRPALRLALGLWVLLFVPFWAPTLRGLPDIAALPLLAAACRQFTTGRLLEEGRTAALLRAGVCLYVPILLRKWYVFPVMAILLAGYGCTLLALYRRNGRVASHAALRAAWRWLALGASIAVACMALQGGMFSQMLEPHYADIYTAYRTTNHQQLLDLARYFGLPLLVLAALSLPAALAEPAVHGRVVALHVLAALLNFLLFTRVQDFEPHHYLSLAYFLLVLSGVGISFVASRLRPVASRVFLAAVALCAGINFATGLGFLWPGLPDPLVATVRFPPLQLPADSDYGGLIEDLDRLLTGTDRTVTVFASSPRLTYGMLYGMMDDGLKPHLAPAGEIDGRDGLYAGALLADYVVVTDPPQFTHAPQSQQVIIVPDLLILGGQGIGAAYRLVARHALGDGVEAYIFRKRRPFTAKEIDLFYAALIHDHPDWAAAYTTGLRALLTSRAREVMLPGSTLTGRIGLQWADAAVADPSGQ